jgi:hypothetical protein
LIPASLPICLTRELLIDHSRRGWWPSTDAVLASRLRSDLGTIYGEYN